MRPRFWPDLVMYLQLLMGRKEDSRLEEQLLGMCTALAVLSFHDMEESQLLFKIRGQAKEGLLLPGKFPSVQMVREPCMCLEPFYDRVPK